MVVIVLKSNSSIEKLAQPESCYKYDSWVFVSYFCIYIENPELTGRFLQSSLRKANELIIIVPYAVILGLGSRWWTLQFILSPLTLTHVQIPVQDWGLNLWQILDRIIVSDQTNISVSFFMRLIEVSLQASTQPASTC